MMPLARRSLIAATLALPVAAAARPGPAETWTRPAGLTPDSSIPLWPADAITAPQGLAERVVQRSDDPAASDRMLEAIVRPRLDVFRPETPNGAAVILAPGGGYRYVVIDKEGYEIARWLKARGVTVYVLFYRLPGDGWSNAPDVPLADAQRAVRLVRSRAAIDGIDASRVVFGGFSAGGHVAASLLTRFDAELKAPVDEIDRLSARPDAVAAVYPVVSMNPQIAHAGSRERLIGAAADAQREAAYSPDRNVRADQPPLWLLHAEDDSVVSADNARRLHAATRAAGAACEAHYFERGEHGFGLMKAAGLPVAVWPDLFWNWLRSRGLV